MVSAPISNREPQNVTKKYVILAVQKFTIKNYFANYVYVDYS